MYSQVKNYLACGKFARKFGKEVLRMKQTYSDEVTRSFCTAAMERCFQMSCTVHKKF
jgi:hypothetical protein